MAKNRRGLGRRAAAPEVQHLLGAAMEDVVPLWFGEGDTPTPEFIRAATAESLARGETFYTPNRGIGPLRQAIADYLTGLHARPVALNRVTATLSGMNAIMLAMQTIVEPGDRVAILSENRAEYVEALMACARGGFILCCQNWRLAEAELAHCLGLVAPRATLASPRYAELAARPKAREVVESCTFKELQGALKSRGLRAAGKTAELKARLEDALVAERLVVELEALELDAQLVRAVRQRDAAEVRVAGLRADAGELLGGVLDHVVTPG